MRRVALFFAFGLAAQPAAACHKYRYWHFHFPQSCGHAHRTASVRYHRIAARGPPEPVSAITRGIAIPAPKAPTPLTERQIGLEALRREMETRP